MNQWHKIVPLDPIANLQFRAEMHQKAANSASHRRALRKMCQEDTLFFINAYAWTYQPTINPDQPNQPFITFHRQTELALDLIPTIGKRHSSFLKSRSMGMSWMLLLILLPRWLWWKLQSFGLASQTDDLTDTPGNYRSLIPKVDYALKRLPAFLKPKKVRRKKGELHNLETDSIYCGSARTKDGLRSERHTALLLDEFGSFELKMGELFLSALQSVSECNWILSTPQGSVGAFHHIVKKTAIKNYKIHWSQWPLKAAGLYKFDGKTLKIVDETFPFPPDYPFVPDNRLRSPWYDQVWNEIQIASIMAQEHDCSFIGSGDPVFNPIEVDRIRKEHCVEPTSRWSIERNNIIKDPNGPILVWANTTDGGPPRDRRYGAGCDVSAGTGASDSTCEIFDWRTRKKACEYVVNDQNEYKFAKQCAMIGRFFSDYEGRPAQMVWEANGGLGRNFGNELIDQNYENLYWAPSDDDLQSAAKPGVPGFWSTASSKKTIIRSYFRALAACEVIDSSLASVDELHDFVYGPGGKICHKADLPSHPVLSGKGENHGDRVMGSSLAYHIMPPDDQLFVSGEVQMAHGEIADMIEEQREYEFRTTNSRDGWCRSHADAL